MSCSEITIIVNTLNDTSRNLDEFFVSLVRNKPAEIIVVDGQSNDGTAEIAKKYTNSVYVTGPGISKQQYYGVKRVKTKYLFLVATDIELPDDTLSKLQIEFENNDCFAVQAKLKVKMERNFFEKGKKIFLDFLQEGGKYYEFLNGPSLFITKKYLPIIKEMANSKVGQGYAADTLRTNILKKKGIYKFLRSKFFVFQNEKLNFKSYAEKVISYGVGDYFYYNSNKSKWSYVRCLKSLTYVFNKYIIYFPCRSIFRRDLYIAIPFFWLTALLRYYGFLKTMLFYKKPK